MNEQPKSIGGALVDVFDAATTLVKTEINAVIRTISAAIRAKGLGVVLLLAAAAPLTMALIFLILFVFYGLMRLGLGAWAAALIIALFSLVVTGALVFLGLKRLSAEVRVEPKSPTELKRDEYVAAEKKVEQAEQTVKKADDRLHKAEQNLEKKAKAAEADGIPVSTRPTYQDDIRRGDHK